jgi:hypothetical protein
MRVTIRQALEAATNLLNSLVYEPGFPDAMVEVRMIGDRFYVIPVATPKPTYNKNLFYPIETDTYINEGEILSFDYTDSDGERTSRVGVVHEPYKMGKQSPLAGIFDLDKGEYRYFAKERMSNIWWMKPLDE